MIGVERSQDKELLCVVMADYFILILAFSSGMYSYSLNYLQNDMDKFIPASRYIFYGIQSFNKLFGILKKLTVFIQ